MTDPFFKAIPGGPILAEDWNNMQVKMRDELTARISAHTHTGATEGKKLTGDGIDPTSVLKVNQLDAAVSLSVKNIDVLGRLNTLDAQKLALTGGSITGALSVTGNVGIGTTTPGTKLDIQAAARTGAHGTARVLYVTGDFGEADGVEFRHSNGTQGIGFGHNTVYATGSNTDQDLGLKARGNGKVTVRGDLKVGGASLLGSAAKRILETNGTDDWLRVNPGSEYKAVALYNTVAIGDGGLSIGDWSQLPKGSVKATGTIQTEQDLVLGANANNKKFTLLSRSANNGDYLQITSDTATGTWDVANGITLKRGGNVGIGTTTPNKRLTVEYSGTPANHANMELTQPGNVSWGVALVVRTTGGIDGASILLRSRTKNWQLRGETGASATGFQISEDGGDAEYGSGAGTPRLHISAGGNVGIGTTTPVARLDLLEVARSGTHPTAVKGLYVTGTFGESSDGVEFRHTNGTQGIGFGHNTIYATGSNANQDLNLQARGTGAVRARVNTNLMQLERTSSTVGKAIFLELLQGTQATQDVFPSIRFHHAGRHWSRIEASNGRFHFKDGNLLSDDYVDAAARSFYVGGENPAPGCPEQVRMLRGFVTSSGGTRGSGFTVRWVENGICEITFSKAFTDAPIVVAAQMFSGTNEKGGDTRDNAVVISSFTNRARVKTGNGEGVATSRDFHFIAIGGS